MFKKISLFLISGLIILLPFTGSAQNSTNQESNSTSGYNTQRIEEEEKLSLPADKATEVWNFLVTHFVQDQKYLISVDPLLSATSSTEFFIDTYFDTPDLQMLAKSSGIRYRQRSNLTNKSDVKDGRELVQIKINNISENKLQRAEYKFKVTVPNNSGEYREEPPILALIDSTQLDDFKSRVASLGLDANKLKKILTLEDTRQRIYIKRADQTIISLSLDHVQATVWGKKTEFWEIEPEINEVAFTDTDETGRKYLQELNNKFIQKIKDELSYIQSDLKPKYNKTFECFEKQLPFWKFYLKHQQLIYLSAIILLIILIGICLWFFRERN